MNGSGRIWQWAGQEALGSRRPGSEGWAEGVASLTEASGTVGDAAERHRGARGERTGMQRGPLLWWSQATLARGQNTCGWREEKVRATSCSIQKAQVGFGLGFFLFLTGGLVPREVHAGYGAGSSHRPREAWLGLCCCGWSCLTSKGQLPPLQHMSTPREPNLPPGFVVSCPSHDRSAAG